MRHPQRLFRTPKEELVRELIRRQQEEEKGLHRRDPGHGNRNRIKALMQTIRRIESRERRRVAI